jgi:hypothetical protein
MLRIEENSSTTYHPQTDGQMECVNCEVEKYLWMFVNQKQDDWVDWLPLAEFTYNNVKHEATSYSPFFLNKGRHLCTLPTDPVSGENLSANEYLEELNKVTKNAENSLRCAKEAMKARWIGQRVKKRFTKLETKSWFRPSSCPLNVPLKNWTTSGEAPS